ncbi:MAG: cytochrome b N-terminal domain-containing protein [Thermodesulfovibrionales bacterium]|nr:cytochrome b N-terminal domain-containing protein [Thermodesulfovibrionales bacterium]
MNLIDILKKKITQSQIWRSLFRHGYADTERNRSLQVNSNWVLHFHPVKVKAYSAKFRYVWCMGGITFFLFLVLTVTGILLMFYYHPVTEYAYQDMKYLQSDIAFGNLLRNIHRWGAHLMVVTVIFHMLRVFLTGSYKPPREFNWVIGVSLLVSTLLMSFTGYLLPWDQLAYWAITVGTNMAKATPFLGHEGPFPLVTKYNDVAFILLGGTEIGGAALLRFYVLHVVFIPAIMIIGMGVHFWRIRKDGISGPL